MNVVVEYCYCYLLDESVITA